MFDGNEKPTYLKHYLRKNGSVRKSFPTLKELKKGYIDYLLNLTGNNVSEAARVLNISRATIYKRASILNTFN